MKKHEVVDAIFDILTIGVLVFTVMLTVNDPLIRYCLTILGCGAMFNNVKYAMKKKKKNNKKKAKNNKDKKKKEVKKEEK
jgi:F0F1-type ATP synthase assembly protein I